jgi:phenol 2-monooxygenase
VTLRKFPRIVISSPSQTKSVYSPHNSHVHSVLGAFGLNSSIWDASNLTWKLGLCLRNVANPAVLLPTYDNERRLFANRVIRCSGAYLRFICNSDLPLAELRGLDDVLESYPEKMPAVDDTVESGKRFLGAFFGQYAMFFIGMEGPIVNSVICPAMPEGGNQTPTTVVNGARAPNPRICFDDGHTSYLYDKMLGVARFHLLLFASDLRGPVRERFAHFSQKGLGPGGFWERYGGRETFNVVLVVKALPYEKDQLLNAQDGESDDLKYLREKATVVFDDRVPDEDAHYWYGINHARGAVVVVRPDLWLGMSAWPEDVGAVEEYFGGFLVDQDVAQATVEKN